MAGYIQSFQASVLLFPAIALLLFVPLRYAHFKRFGELHEYRAFVSYLGVFAFMTAMLLTVLPLPPLSQAQCDWRAMIGQNQFTPFDSFIDIARYERRHALGWSPQALLANKALLQIAFNTLMLAPVGFLFRALYGVGLATTLVLALLISLFLEATQLTGIWGLANCPYRVFDVDDLITNTLGAGCGWALFSLFRWLPDPRANEDQLWYRKGKRHRGGRPSKRLRNMQEAARANAEREHPDP